MFHRSQHRGPVDQAPMALMRRSLAAKASHLPAPPPPARSGAPPLITRLEKSGTYVCTVLYVAT